MSSSLATAVAALNEEASLGFQAFELEPDENAPEAVMEVDFLILAYPPGEQEDVIIRELAADRHVLAVEHLAANAAEAQRCVTIALNRGLRLAVLKLTEPVEPQIEQFAAWIDGGSEPEHSGRRWLARQLANEATP
jgi:hypothetical protein